MKKRILILGATGMLGHVLLRYFLTHQEYEVFGTTRDLSGLPKIIPSELASRFKQDIVDADNFDSVIRALASIQPDIVINCIGLIKQLPISSDPLSAITVNALLPHRISLISITAGARMIHISTDCVFNGVKGNYTEKDPSSAEDLYGQTKFLGEVTYPHCVTLRTSIIGHELKGGYGLIDWFLAQHGNIRGFSKAIYSGFPTVEMARIIINYILPNEKLNGLYHVSSCPISKYELLKMVAERYDKRITIEPCDDFALDRSMDSSIFRSLTGYVPPTWTELVDTMYRDYDANRTCYEKNTVAL